jgi:hypothetical protein
VKHRVSNVGTKTKVRGRSSRATALAATEPDAAQRNRRDRAPIVDTASIAATISIRGRKTRFFAFDGLRRWRVFNEAGS